MPSCIQHACYINKWMNSAHNRHCTVVLCRSVDLNFCMSWWKVLSLHKQPFVTAHFQFITAHRHSALKMPCFRGVAGFCWDQPQRFTPEFLTVLLGLYCRWWSWITQRWISKWLRNALYLHWSLQTTTASAVEGSSHQSRVGKSQNVTETYSMSMSMSNVNLYSAFS